MRSARLNFTLALALLVSSMARPAWAQVSSGDCLRAAVRSLQSLVQGHPPADEFPISYGFEIEANAIENPNMVLDYRLTTHTEAQWLALPVERRIEFARAWEKENRHSFHKLAYERLSTADPALPRHLETEGDGNVEFNNLIFQDFAAAKSFMEGFVQRYGRASFQAHVVFPQRKMPGAAGYTVFESDRAQLKTLETGFDRFEKDPKLLPGKNLSHHSLGPLAKRDGEKFRQYEQAIAEGRSIGNPSTSRIIYGPTFRGDVYPQGKVGYEFRQYHKRYEEMLEEMARLSGELREKRSLERYSSYSDVELIHGQLPRDRATEHGIELHPQWDNFFWNLADTIRAPFPNLMYGAAPLPERFYFPLRNWSANPVIQSLPQAEKAAALSRIRDATRKYLEAANTLVAEGRTDAETVKKFQILNAQWAHETKLSQYFESFRNQYTPPAPLAQGALQAVRGPPRPPVIQGLQQQVKKFPDGREHVRYRMDPERVDPKSYDEFLENTVEVIYSKSPPFGHIRLRVGKKLYGFEYLQWTKAIDFRPVQSEGTKGAVFYVPKEKIESVQGEIRKFYKSSQDYNVPPFDAYSPKIEVLVEGGEIRFKSPSPEYGNNLSANAQLTQRDGQTFLETENGLSCPLEKRGGKMYIQSFSCSTSATHQLITRFEIDVEFSHGAKSLIESLQRGNPGGTAPDALIDYSP